MATHLEKMMKIRIIISLLVLLALLVSVVPTYAQVDLEPKPTPTPVAKPKPSPVPVELRPTDPTVLKVLQEQGIDVQYVKLEKDYSAEAPYSQVYVDTASDKAIEVFTQSPMYNSRGEKIEVVFYWDGMKFRSKTNTLTVTVDGVRVLIAAILID